MKKTAIFTVLAVLLVLLSCACSRNLPPEGDTPAPPVHEGVFTGEYGTMTFNGDGESITVDFSPALCEATGLPAGEQSGSYVFLFQHGQWRYDKADRFRITVSDASYDFVNVFTETNEKTITLVTPLDGGGHLLFIKGEN